MAEHINPSDTMAAFLNQFKDPRAMRDLPESWTVLCPVHYGGRSPARVRLDQDITGDVWVHPCPRGCLPAETIRWPCRKPSDRPENIRPYVHPSRRAGLREQQAKAREAFTGPGVDWSDLDGQARYERLVELLSEHYAGTRTPGPQAGTNRFTCPACGALGDGHGLKVDFKDGRPLLHCFSCGSGDEVLAALGLSWSDITGSTFTGGEPTSDEDTPDLTAKAAHRKARSTRPVLDMGSAMAAADWLREELGTGLLAGYFLRGEEVVHTPAEGQDGYTPPGNEQDHDGPAQVRPVTAGNISARVSFTYDCRQKQKLDNGWVLLSKPFHKAAAQLCLDAADMLPGLRRLRGVTHTPLVRADGSVLDTPGYDEATKLLFLPEPGLAVPPVPECPTREQVQTAVTLLDEMVAGFPFVSANDRANFFGLLLTPLLRELVGPPYKLGVFTAPMRRSGKTLLTTVLRTLHGGVFRAECPTDEAEWSKTLSTILNVTTAPVVTFDNVTGTLKSGTLDGLLTSASFDARQLGRTDQMIQRRNDRLWTITSNNAQLGGDLVPRALWVAIDPGAPRPQDRTGFAIADLPGWVREHRGELLAALLTLVRAWVALDRPAQPAGDIFGRWVGVVRGILYAAELAGTFDAPESSRQQVSEEDEEAGRFLAAAEEVFGDRAWTVRELLEHVEAEAYQVAVVKQPPIPVDVLPGWVAEKQPGARARVLGKWLRFRVGAWFGDAPPRCIRDAGVIHSTQLWRTVTSK